MIPTDWAFEFDQWVHPPVIKHGSGKWTINRVPIKTSIQFGDSPASHVWLPEGIPNIVATKWLNPAYPAYMATVWIQSHVSTIWNRRSPAFLFQCPWPERHSPRWKACVPTSRPWLCCGKICDRPLELSMEPGWAGVTAPRKKDR